MLKSLKAVLKFSVRPAAFSQKAWDGALEIAKACEYEPAAMRNIADGDKRRDEKVSRRTNRPANDWIVEQAEAVEYLAQTIEA